MKCLILWSNDKEKKTQQNENRKYCSVLYYGTLLNDCVSHVTTKLTD